MIQIAIDQQTIEEMAREAIEQRMKELDQHLFFMNSKQVLRYVNMSWNSFNDNIMSDPKFTAAIRLGNKWLFNKKELDNYLEAFFLDVRDSGGNILAIKKR